MLNMLKFLHHIFCMFFQGKCFSCHILLTDQISLPRPKSQDKNFKYLENEISSLFLKGLQLPKVASDLRVRLKGFDLNLYKVKRKTINGNL